MNSVQGFEPQACHVFKMDKQTSSDLYASAQTETVTACRGMFKGIVPQKVIFHSFATRHFVNVSGDIL